MGPRVTPSSVDDVAFLTRSVHRVRALAALAERPRARSELQELTGASASTVGRTLRQFEDRHWVVRRGHEYEATPLGAFVATGLLELVDRLETERTLRDVWHLLEPAASGLRVEMVADATVTFAEPDDPYRPVDRFASLLDATEQFRFVGVELPLLEPCRDEFCRQVAEGMEAEVVDSPAVVRRVRSTHPGQFAAAVESGNLTVRVHDDPPSCGLGLFDDCVAVGGYAPESGAVRVLLESDGRGLREWAESTYERYRREARPLEALAAG